MKSVPARTLNGLMNGLKENVNFLLRAGAPWSKNVVVKARKPERSEGIH
jgi:hypothetical protein